MLEIEVTNEGAMVHSFMIDDIDGDVVVSGAARLEQTTCPWTCGSGPGESGAFPIQVHEPGKYEFYCAVPGHAEAGQVGTLITR